MKMRQSFFLLVASSLLLWGCAPGVWQTQQTVSPTSYQTSLGHISRNVGKLRRLNVLAIYQQPPEVCVPSSDGEAMVLSPLGGQATYMLDYLKTHKGYETTPLDASRYPTWMSNSNNQEFRKEILEWSASTNKDAPLGPLATALLEQMAVSEKVDGLLLIHIQYSCLYGFQEFRVPLALMSLGTSELLKNPRALELNGICRVAILESTSRKVVWRNSTGMDMSHLKHYSCQTDSEENMNDLFKDLEPAIPKLLTR